MNLALSELRRIITELRERSQHLERTDQLLGYAWRCVTETQVGLTYIFQDSGNVLVLRDGKVSRGTYQILDRADALLLEVDGETLLYKEAFVDAAVLILYSDGQQEQLTILVNERMVADLDVQRYLDETYLRPMREAAEQQRLAERQAALKEASKNFVRRSLGSIGSRELVVWLPVRRQYDPVGARITLGDEPAPDDEYEQSSTHHTYVARSGVVTEYYHSEHVQLSTGQTLTLQNCYYRGRLKGQPVLLDGSPAPTGTYKVGWLDKVRVVDGRLA